MKTSSTGLQLIESFEGLILQSYDDYNDRIIKVGDTSRGTLTIGYGHTTSAGEPKVFPGQKITEEEADRILQADLRKVEANVDRLVKVKINQNQFDALVSFEFNTGGLSQSSVLRKLNSGDYDGAADALLLWTKANGQTLPGLLRRRQAERTLFQRPYVAPSQPGPGTAAVGFVGLFAMLTGHPWAIIAGAALIGAALYYIIHKHTETPSHV